jgi:serine/threonine-protein phosphatase 6 regulatory ankyrin repeat subunit A
MFFTNSENQLCSALFTASFEGNRELVNLLVSHGADVNSLDRDGETSLHKASARGNLDVVKFLIIHGAEIDIKANDGTTPLYLAAYYEKKDVALLLLDYGAAISPDISLMLGDFQFVSQYLQQGGDPNSKLIKDGNNAPSWLYQAVGARAKNPQLVKVLLTYGAKVNEKIGTEQSTALHIASTIGSRGTFAPSRDIAKLLIEYGADINARDREEQTPLHWAALVGNQDVVELLIEAGADVNAKNISLDTPLHLAARSGNEESLKLLIEFGADVNVLNSKNNPPLFEAILRNCPSLIETLLIHNAEINLTDKFDEHLLSIACNSCPNLEIIKLLIKYGGNVHLEDPQGFSLLNKAVSQKNFLLVRLLLESGSTIGL